MLNEMRFGCLSIQSVNKFKALSRPINYDDGMGATELYVTLYSIVLFLIARSASRAVKMSIELIRVD